MAGLIFLREELDGGVSGDGITIAESFDERPDFLMQISGYPLLLRGLTVEAQAQAIAGVRVVSVQELCVEEASLCRYGRVETLEECPCEIGLRTGFGLEFNVQN